MPADWRSQIRGILSRVTVFRNAGLCPKDSDRPAEPNPQSSESNTSLFVMSPIANAGSQRQHQRHIPRKPH